MKNYCPYSNISHDAVYPNMLIVGGMNDPRVAYFEPAKWTAKLRSTARWSEDRLLLLKIQDAGHSGSSGRYAYLEDLAFEYAFLISTLGVQFRPVPTNTANSTAAVDYDMYWQGLEDEDLDDEDCNAEAAEEKKPSTPLQRFSAYWRKRGQKREEKKRLRRERKQSHKQSPSTSPTKERGRRINSTVTNASSRLSAVYTTEDTSDVHVQTDVEDTNCDDNIIVPPQSAIGSGGSLENSDAELDNNNATKPVFTTRHVAGSKASLRHHLYPHDEESGRVQSTSKVYNFLSKFF